MYHPIDHLLAKTVVLDPQTPEIGEFQMQKELQATVLKKNL